MRPLAGEDVEIDPVLELDSALVGEEGEGRIRRDRVPPELLGRPRPLRLLRAALVDWSVIVACWLAMWHGPHWVYPAAALLVGGRFYALAVLQHDASHMPVRARGPLMALLDVLCGYPLAITRDVMRANHVRHHRNAGLATDPYFHGGKFGRPAGYALCFFLLATLLPHWYIRSFLGTAACVFPRLRRVYAKFHVMAPGETWAHPDEIRRCIRSDVPLCAVHVALGLAAVAWPEAILHFYVVPAFIGLAFQAYRFLADHAPTPNPDRSPESILRTTRDTTSGLLRWLFFSPHNIGYHVVHHLHPQVAYEHLPGLRRWYVERYPGRYPLTPAWWPSLRVFSCDLQRTAEEALEQARRCRP